MIPTNPLEKDPLQNRALGMGATAIVNQKRPLLLVPGSKLTLIVLHGRLTPHRRTATTKSFLKITRIANEADVGVHRTG